MMKTKCSDGGVIYGMGCIGALVFFISNSGSFLEGILGIFKAVFWPAFAVYGLLDYLLF